MKAHKLSEIFPLMQDHEIQSMADDIKANGLNEPIILFEGQILDGRNRYKACLIAGVEPRYLAFTDLADVNTKPLDFVVSTNLKRRHLNETQRASIAAKLANMTDGNPTGANQHRRNRANLPGSTSNTQAAARLNVSERSVKAAKKVHREAEPEIVSAMDRGTIAVSTAAEAATLPPEAQREVAALPKKDQRAAIIEKKTQPTILDNSNRTDEWYTPSFIIEAARQVMSSIELDPASCEAAQRTVRASVFFSKDDDGLSKTWAGRVWLNPPYSRELLPQFCEKMASSIESGDVDTAIILVNSSTETAWFRRLSGVCNMICFPSKRINFNGANGEKGDGNSRPQTLFYFGDDDLLFSSVFGKLGNVYTRVAP
jgi:ParB family chromosome partitioning protein